MMRIDEGPGPNSDVDRLNDLELVLRTLPGVLAVGVEDGAPAIGEAADTPLTIHILVADPKIRAGIEQQAVDLGRLHLRRPLRVVVATEGDAGAGGVSVAAPSIGEALGTRVRLVEVVLADGGRSVSITLSHGDVALTGLGPAGSPGAAARAAIDVLHALGWSVPFDVGAAVRLAVGVQGAVLVQLVGDAGPRLGVSQGVTAEEAAVKATLHALNRWLDDPSRRPVRVRQG